MRLQSVSGIALSLTISALSTDQHHSHALSPSSYQKCASVPLARGDRDGRSARSKVDRRKVRPHLCAPTQASVTALFDPPPSTQQTPIIASAGPSHARCVPLLPSPRWRVSPYPSCPLELSPQHLTLPSSCVQQQASSCNRRMGSDACRVFFSALHRSLHVSAAVLGLCVARVTGPADMNPLPRLYRLCISNPASPVWRRCLAHVVQEQCLS